jgi:hypothetical protein
MLRLGFDLCLELANRWIRWGIEQQVRADPDPVRSINSRVVHSMPSGWEVVNTGFVNRRHKQNP